MPVNPGQVGWRIGTNDNLVRWLTWIECGKKKVGPFDQSLLNSKKPAGATWHCRRLQ